MKKERKFKKFSDKLKEIKKKTKKDGITTENILVETESFSWPYNEKFVFDIRKRLF